MYQFWEKLYFIIILNWNLIRRLFNKYVLVCLFIFVHYYKIKLFRYWRSTFDSCGHSRDARCQCQDACRHRRLCSRLLRADLRYCVSQRCQCSTPHLLWRLPIGQEWRRPRLSRCAGETSSTRRLSPVSPFNGWIFFNSPHKCDSKHTSIHYVNLSNYQLCFSYENHVFKLAYLYRICSFAHAPYPITTLNNYCACLKFEIWQIGLIKCHIIQFWGYNLLCLYF